MCLGSLALFMDDDTHKGYLLFPAAANATPMPTFSDPTSDNYIRRAFLMRLKGISADPLTIARLRNEYTLKHYGKIERQQSKSKVDFMTRLPSGLSLFTRILVGHILCKATTRSHHGFDVGTSLAYKAKELWVYVDVRASQPDAIATLAAKVFFGSLRVAD
jgi:hypothetical protein